MPIIFGISAHFIQIPIAPLKLFHTQTGPRTNYRYFLQNINVPADSTPALEYIINT